MSWRRFAVLKTILKCAMAHGKFYSFPSQKTICKYLRLYYGIDRSERSVRRDIKWLKENKWLVVVRRTLRGCPGKKLFTSNLYKVCYKAFMLLKGTENLIKNIFSHFHRPKVAHYQLPKKQAFTPALASSGKSTWVPDKVGPVPIKYTVEEILKKYGN